MLCRKLNGPAGWTVSRYFSNSFSGTRSLPFATGEHRRIAVKVIDPRGNDMMQVMGLGDGTTLRKPKVEVDVRISSRLHLVSLYGIIP
jgi:hypothetical protein